MEEEGDEAEAEDRAVADFGRYPLSVQGIQREYPEKSVSQAESILHAGLSIALDSTPASTSTSSSSSSSSSRNPIGQAEGKGKERVVLALGPYGATTKPGSEYSGLYPGPYGFGSVLDPGSSNSATDLEDKRAEDALYEWHKGRLEAYRKSERWGEVEWVGYETIPLIREIKAIRRAIASFSSPTPSTSSNTGTGDKGLGVGPKVWIGCTFPDGLSPQTKHGETRDGGRYSVEDTVRALLEGDEGRPEGVGINCTNPAFLPTLVQQFNDTLRTIQSDQLSSQQPSQPPQSQQEPAPTSTSTSTLGQRDGGTGTSKDDRPWFIVYPDGGQVYDPLTRTWSKEKMTPQEWAERMMDVVKDVDQSGLWTGMIVGGCCKTSADEIGELRRRVDEYVAARD